MRNAYCRSPLAATAALALAAAPGFAAAPATATAAPSPSRLPLSFEANRGQTDARVRFLSRGPGYRLFLTNDAQAVFTLTRPKAEANKAAAKKAAGVPLKRHEKGTIEATALALRLVGARPAPKASASNRLPGVSNYFVGRDASKWRRGVPAFARVDYDEVYPGVDLSYYGTAAGALEYDFAVAPGADPSKIALAVRGARSVSVDAKTGDLVLKTALGPVRWARPVAYQVAANGKRVAVASRYALASNASDRFGFKLGKYDRSRPLVIDPVFRYATYVGGTAFDFATAVARDSANNTYLTGRTTSANFPTSDDAYTTTFQTPPMAFVTKLSPTGRLVYSSYLGGDDETFGDGIAASDDGFAYVTGGTYATNLPLFGADNENPFQPENAGDSDAFVAKFSQDGQNLVYSTYLGGEDYDNGFGIDVDPLGHAYVVGQTNSLLFPAGQNLGGGASPAAVPTGPALQTAFGGLADAFVTKLSPDGSILVYSTYFGGEGVDTGFGIDVIGENETDQRAFITGAVAPESEATLPVSQADPGVQQEFGGGQADAYVAMFLPDGSDAVFAAVGGSDLDIGNGIAVTLTAASFFAHITGETRSADFPTAGGAFDTTLGGENDAFVTKVEMRALPDPFAQVVYSSYLGGSGDDVGWAIDAQRLNDVWLTGETESGDFPRRGSGTTAKRGGSDAFITNVRATADGPRVNFSTFYGGGGNDSGNGIAVTPTSTSSSARPLVFVVGDTRSADIPRRNAFQNTYRGARDAFALLYSPFE